MIINVKVHPNSKESKIDKQENCYIVNLKSPAESNRANIELIKLLSEYFNVSQMGIRIKRGKTSRKKVIEVNQKNEIRNSID